MSLYFGLLAVQQAGPADAQLGAVAALFDRYPGEQTRRWQRGGIGVLHRAQRNTPQSLFEQQPLEYADDTERYCLVADARLDNRAELIGKLAGHPLLQARSPDEIADDRLILAAYLTWGSDAPARLLGDFSFAVFHAVSREAFFARDHLGVKNLYLARQGPLLLVANVPDAFAVLPDFDRGLDAESLAGFIATGALLDRHRTFYENVRRLPAGCWCRVSIAGEEETRYWKPETCPPRTFASAAEAAQALKSLLEDAVTARLHTVHPVATHLSGGLDSAAVSALACRLGAAQELPLTGFSWVSESQDGQEYTEWGNARRLAAELGLPVEGLRLSVDDVLRQLQSMDIARLDGSDAWYESLLLKRASGQGMRTVLSGWGGDELISYAGRRALVDQLLSLKPGWVGKELLASGPGALHSIKALVKGVIYPLAGNVYARWFAPRFADARRELSAYHPDIGQATGWERWVYPGQALSVRAEQLALLEQGHLPARMESWGNAGKHFAIDYRYPLLDKRVVEFAIAMPAGLYRSGGVGRWLFREALRDDLPAWLREGNWKLEQERVRDLLQAIGRAAQRWNQEPVTPGYRARLKDGRAVIPEQQIRKRLESVTDLNRLDMENQVLNVQCALAAMLTARAGWTHGSAD